MAVQQRAGSKAIYLSEMPADANLSGHTLPRPEPSQLSGAGRRSAGSPTHCSAPPDGHRGRYFGGELAARRLSPTARLAGAPTVYELQKALIAAGRCVCTGRNVGLLEKKCGHLGGKVRMTQQHTAIFDARSARGRCGSTMVIARTDAEAATPDHLRRRIMTQPFITGER